MTGAMIDKRGNDPTSFVFSKQSLIEGEVSPGPPEQGLTNLYVVFLEEVRRITDIDVEQTRAIAEENQSAYREDSDNVLSHILGLSTIVLEDSGNQRLIKDDSAEFQTRRVRN